MRSAVFVLCLIVAGCEISPVEARSMDWELESATPAAASSAPSRPAPPIAAPSPGAAASAISEVTTPLALTCA